VREIAILVAAEYEDLEAWYPKLRLEAAGFDAPLVGVEKTKYAGKWGYPALADHSIDEIDAASLAGVLAPGGWAPDKLRRDKRVLDLVRSVNAAGRNAGAEWVDEAVVVDRNLVSSRVPKDLPAFGEAMVDWLERRR